MTNVVLILTLLVAEIAIAQPPDPRIECDASMLARARERIAENAEPFHISWQLAKAEAAEALKFEPKPCLRRDSLVFHGEAQTQGIAARLLA